MVAALIRFVLHWFALSVALAATAWCLPGITVQGWEPVVLGGLALGLVNATVQPLLQFISLPLSILTLGLFALVVNGASFALAAWFVPGFSVDGVLWAIVGALVFSVLSTIIGGVVRGPDRRVADDD